MVRSKPTSILRSIRMPTALEELLRADATAKGISVNAMVTAILTKYAEWDRYTEKFGFVTITRNGHRGIIEGLDEASLERVARELGAQNPREMTLFWFKRLDLETFLAYLSLISRYAKWVEFEVQRDSGHTTVLCQHELGPRYSKYIGIFMEQAVREIVGVVPKCQIGRNTVVLKFTAA